MQAQRSASVRLPTGASVRLGWPSLSGLRTWLALERGWVAAWLATGMALRVWAFSWFPPREDEALYAYWARLIASGQDVMLEHVAVDKPPFFIYTLARFFAWFGPTLDSGRLLNEICSLLAMVLVWALARRLYGSKTALVVLALFAISPFAISFAPTLYTDPMMVTWLLLALLCASYGFGLGAGLAVGMAFASKQNALLFIPLVLIALILGVLRSPASVFRLPSPILRPSRVFISLSAALAGFLFVWHKVWQWDGWRILPAEIPSFWEQSWHSYGGLGWIPVGQWGERMGEWAQVWQWLGGWVGGTVALAFLGGLAVMAGKYQAVGCPSPIVHRSSSRLWDWLFLGFTFAYLAGHALFSFQPWDRYLLGMAPLLALLAGRGAIAGWERCQQRTRIRGLAAVMLAAMLLVGALGAAGARIPIGSDHGAYGGIEEVAAYLRVAVPNDHGVLYQRWLGWHWNWYLWDGPRGRVYWANPAMLVDDLRSDPFGYSRWVVFPAWHDGDRWELTQALHSVGLRLEERLIVRRADGDRQFTVYQLVPELAHDSG